MRFKMKGVLRISCICSMLLMVYCQPERSFTSTISIDDPSLGIMDSGLCRDNATAKRIQSMIVVSNIDGETVYVGATNNILQLSPDLIFKTKYVTEPTLEDPGGNCLSPPQCPGAECPDGVCTDTYNKFLVAYRDRIIACGTAYMTCNLLMAANVSNEFMPEDDRIHCHSTNSHVSIREQAPPLVATVFVNENEVDEDLLYVGMSGMGHNIITYLAPSATNPFFSRIDNTDEYTGNMITSTYIFAWSTDTNAYILSKYRGDGRNFQTKLVRLCHMFIAPDMRPVSNDDRATLDETLGKTSYTQVNIRCNVNGVFYENSIHAEFVFNMLFILFERGGKYVICSQPFAEVNNEIDFARRACLNATDFSLAENMDGTPCGPAAVANLEDIEVTCAYRRSIAEFFSAIAITDPMEMSVQLECPEIGPDEVPTTFVMGKTNEIFAAFIGTSNGRIIKAPLEGTSASISELIVLDKSNPVLKDMVLSEDGNNLYSITDTAVFKVNTASCETQYPSCGSCVVSRDPYCGWCVYENKCTRNSACDGFESVQRWIQSTRTVADCPVISVVQPNSIVYQSTETIVLTLEGSELLTNLPLSYRCEFIGNDNTIVSPPSDLDGIVTNSPSCTFDSIANEAVIPPGYDHVNVTLSLIYDNVRVAEGSFQVFDCSVIGEINQFSMCASCTSSNWPCRWCLGSDTCSNNDCPVGSTELNNSSFCPLITGIAYPTQPVSVGENHAIQFSTERIPTERTYVCWFEVCGSTTSSSVVVNVNSGILSCTVLASQLTCAESSFELTVSVRTGDYVIDKMPGRSMTVTVFNCSAESVDCGRCVYLSSKFAECAWCSPSSMCSPMNACMGDSVTSIDQCSPPTIESISPSSGPIEGGTVVMINGRNLGTQFSDISSVRIGDINCVVQPAFYQPSLRIQCLTEPSENGAISDVVVVATNFTNVTAASPEMFNFKVVTSTGFSPALVLNGSTILVYGYNLNVGGPAQLTLTGESGNYTGTCFNRNAGIGTMQCRLPFVSQISSLNVSVQIDSFAVTLNSIKFVQLPKVTVDRPILGFQSAGGEITIRISSSDGVQFANLQVGQGELTSCNIDKTARSISCVLSPASEVMSSQRKKRQVQDKVTTAASVSTTASLIIDGLHRFPLGSVTYVQDPEISPLLNELPCSTAPTVGGETPLQNITQSSTLNGLTGTIEIRGSNFDATGAVESDFEVTLTPTDSGDSIPCVVFHLDSNSLFCQASSSLLAEREGQNLLVTVRAFNLNLSKEVVYCTGTSLVIAIAVPVSISAVLIIIILFLVLRHRKGKIKQAEETRMIMTKLDDLENRTRETARKAYYELQVGYMTTLTDNISDRITYLLPTHYFAQTFFNERAGHPVLDHLALEHITASQKSRYLDWIKLLKHKDFLLTFIGTLEEQRKFTVQEKGKVASLLTVCLFSDLAYLTRIMLDLLSRLIQKHVAKNPKLLLRRSESVVEKLVSHWLSITLYEDCITERSGKPLFLLTKAIHYLVNSGPSDVMANKAFNSLNEMTLLGAEIDYSTLTLQASVSKESATFTEVKVVNVDTITQAKTKIIEAIYKDRPYSECPKPDDLEFELLPNEEEKKGIILSDIDNVSESVGNYTKINTLKHYNVPDKAKVVLNPVDYMNSEDTVGGFRQFLDRNYSFSVKETYDCNRMSQDSKVPLLSSRKLYHLIHAEESTGGEDANAFLDNFINKPFEEIYLTRMVKSKSTLQEYVDGVFKSILHPQPIPRAVRYFFQFLDREARKHKISDPEVIHIWKTNSLLLRYWVNILKNPEFLFDTNKTAIVDSCLNVITQAFMDACTTTSRKLGQDSPSNKLLYAKDAEQYKIMVNEFFVDISNTPEIPENGIDDMLQQQSKDYSSNFNELVAAQQLFGYLEKYGEEVIDALKSDNQHSLVKAVEGLMGGNNVIGTTIV